MSSRRTILLLTLATALAGCIEIEREGDTPDRTPVANIAVNPASGPAPLAVSVSGAASTVADGRTPSYAWAFGDGSTATGVTATHTYAAVGEYTLQLTVTDDKGRSGSTTTRVVATGTQAVFNSSVFDGANYQDEPTSGTYDATTLQ
jgi:PKD repeat protein